MVRTEEDRGRCAIISFLLFPPGPFQGPACQAGLYNIAGIVMFSF